MSERKSRSSYFKREELRGLFVLGLLAVVASFRIQNEELMIIIEEKSYNVVVFLDVMLVMWSLYAFFMVLAFSEDIVGKKSASMFREVSTNYLYFSFAMLGLLSILFALFVYPTRTPWALGFLLVLFAYWLIRKSIRIRKSFKLSFKSGFKNLWKRVKGNLYQLLLSAFMVCFLLVMFGTYEEFVIPSFIIGSICLVSFLIVREKVKDMMRKN